MWILPRSDTGAATEYLRPNGCGVSTDRGAPRPRVSLSRSGSAAAAIPARNQEAASRGSATESFVGEASGKRELESAAPGPRPYPHRLPHPHAETGSARRSPGASHRISVVGAAQQDGAPCAPHRPPRPAGGFLPQARLRRGDDTTRARPPGEKGARIRDRHGVVSVGPSPRRAPSRATAFSQPHGD